MQKLGVVTVGRGACRAAKFQCCFGDRLPVGDPGEFAYRRERPWVR